MPVCIAGMHRSGTSMIARMLNLCGLYLGSPEELYPAKPDNPEGFWEHIHFQTINDRLLEALGGAWDKAPALPEGWAGDPRFDALRAEAKDLVAQFADKGSWGWKDPRSSLTLAFWKEVIPDLQILIPVRNPLDVAASLTKRGYASQLFGVELWRDYSEALEREIDPRSAIYTHYTTYFEVAREELIRVAALCGLNPTERQLDEACSTVSGGLKHSHSTLMDMLGSDASPAVMQQYVFACARCGPYNERTSLQEWDELARLTDAADAVRAKDEQIERLRAEVKAERAETASHKVSHLRSEANMVDAQTEIGRLKWELADVRQYLQRVEGELQGIHSSTAWALARRIAQIAPEGSFIQRALRRSRRMLGKSAPAATPSEPEPQPKRKPKGKPDPLEVLGLSATPMSTDALGSALNASLAHPRFALAISHDSIQVFTGGIQTVIHDERARLGELGISQLHVCPLKMIQGLSDDSRELPLLITADGKAIGVANTPQLIEALARRGGCQSIQVHHTINWNLDLLGRLLDSLPSAPKFFWLHDYYTVCESYNLLRNDRAFCFAPPLSSNSCEICKHGPGRARHLPAYKDFLGRWPFTFLVPSQIAASIWLKAYPEYKERLEIAPIYRLEPTSQPNPRTSATERKIRIAFPGISWDYKGWSHWRKLADVLWHNPNYELIHLGQITEEFQHSYLPERFREIKSTAQNTQALADAFVEEQIDIVFYCPIWYETFSLIAHEAHATGCWTLTIQDSGNVAVYVRDSGSGMVFESSDLLITYLLDVAQVREDLDRFQEETLTLSRLQYNTSIVDSLYGSPAATGQPK